MAKSFPWSCLKQGSGQHFAQQGHCMQFSHLFLLIQVPTALFEAVKHRPQAGRAQHTCRTLACQWWWGFQRLWHSCPLQILCGTPGSRSLALLLLLTEGLKGVSRIVQSRAAVTLAQSQLLPVAPGALCHGAALKIKTKTRWVSQDYSQQCGIYIGLLQSHHSRFKNHNRRVKSQLSCDQAKARIRAAHVQIHRVKCTVPISTEH